MGRACCSDERRANQLFVRESEGKLPDGSPRMIVRDLREVDYEGND
jgi:hypothetical protein